MTSFARRVWRSARWIAAAAKGPTILRPERISGLAGLGALHHSAHLSVWPESEDSTCRLSLGRKVYIGKDVEIAAIGPGSVHIGDFTTIQDRCQIYGDLYIGAHCIFARNALVISTEHVIREKPTWLISDQDVLYAELVRENARPRGQKIWIEEDCWLGWGCTIMPGVYIGRGAVIGSNSVVTRNVAPYEIHGGVPNRRISERFDFSPPAAIDALNDRHLPYFYRGFRLRQADLAESRSRGCIGAGFETALVLSGVENPVALITGRRLRDGGPLTLQFSINGADCGKHVIHDEEFKLNVSPHSPHLEKQTRLPPPLQSHTVIEITAENDAPQSELKFELASARLEPNQMTVAAATTKTAMPPFFE